MLLTVRFILHLTLLLHSIQLKPVYYQLLDFVDTNS